MPSAILSFIFLIAYIKESERTFSCWAHFTGASRKVLCKATDSKYTGRPDKVHNISNNNSDPVHGRLHECAYRYVCSALSVPPFHYATQLQNLRFDAPVCMLMQLPLQDAGENKGAFCFFFDKVL